MDRSTPLGNEPYNQRMAVTQKPGGFNTEQKVYPMQNVNDAIVRHPTQHQITQSRGRANDRYGAPQPRKLTALELMEQELLRKNQESINKKGVDPSDKSNMGGGLIQAIQSQQNKGWQSNQSHVNQTLRMPVHAIKGQGILSIQPLKVLSQSPDQIQSRIKMGMPQNRQFGASMVATGISGLGVDQQRSGPTTRQPQIYSPQQLKSIERPPNQYVLSKNNQIQSQLSNALQLKLQQQQQLNQNPQMGLLRTPRRLAHPNSISISSPQSNVYPVTPGDSNYSGQKPFLGQSQERPYHTGTLGQNHNLLSPPRQQPNLADMQRLHFQKQYQQYKRN